MNDRHDREDIDPSKHMRDPEQRTPENDQDVNEALDAEERPTTDRPA